MRHIILLLLTHFSVFQSILLPQQNIFVKEIMKYKEKYDECNMTSSTCFYIHDDTTVAEDVTNSFISHEEKCAALLWSEDCKETDYNDTFLTHDVFVFFENWENIMVKFRSLTNYTFWAAETRVHFIVCTGINTEEFIYRALNSIWEHKIYNFVFIVFCERFKIYTFNNFTANKISFVEYSETFCQNLFPDKVKNLEGRTVKVSVFEKKPIGYFDETTGSFRGPDIEIMNYFAEIINCTLKVYGKLDSYGAIDSLQRNETDIIFVAILQVKA